MQIGDFSARATLIIQAATHPSDTFLKQHWRGGKNKVLKGDLVSIQSVPQIIIPKPLTLLSLSLLLANQNLNSFAPHFLFSFPHDDVSCKSFPPHLAFCYPSSYPKQGYHLVQEGVAIIQVLVWMTGSVYFRDFPPMDA